MRRLGFIVLVLILVLSLFYVQLFDVPVVEASSIYQGDLVLSGNNVTIIEGRFDINGSISVEGNATLILQNAILNLTQSQSYEHIIHLGNPSNGNPRLLAYNSIITSTSDYKFSTILTVNSSVIINNSTINSSIKLDQYSSISTLNNSYVYGILPFYFSVARIEDSSIDWLYCYESSDVQVIDSEIDYFNNIPESVNCTIFNLEPGHINYWNFFENCSLSIQSGGRAPNVTLRDTEVKKWLFLFNGNSNASISNSTVYAIAPSDTSVLHVKSSIISDGVSPSVNGTLFIEDSIIQYVRVYQSANAWLLNSTYVGLHIAHTGKIFVSWYLDVTVEDSVGQIVPSATVSVTFPNSTLVDSKLTDDYGLARFPLMEKVRNETGEYPVGNYTVEATYDTYLSSTTVNMTQTQQLILTLENFVIPEFSSLVLISTLIIATLAVLIVGKNKSKK